MTARTAGVIIATLLEWAIRAVIALTRQLARGITAGLLRFLPPPQTKPVAIGRAVGIGFVLLLLVALLGLAVGGRTGAIIVGGLGLVLAGFVSWALIEQGTSAIAIQRGAIAVGTRTGALSLATPQTIARPTRLRHVAVFGATGSGKSTVIKNLAQQDLAAPDHPGLLCVDIKDDLVTDIALQAPSHRIQDIVLFDPTDTAYPPAFNPLAGVAPAERTLAAAELVAAFKRLYADSWGPRLEHVLRAVVLTLLETPDATMLDISRLLADQQYRSWALTHVTNFSVQQFWQQEYPAIAGPRNSLANVGSILNKLGVLSYPEIRNVLGQTRRGLNLRAAMDRGMVILANLPQGVLGEDASNFLAALLIGKVQLAAQSRVTLPHARRKPFYVFADEFQNYETSAFTKLVTEGRSMGVGLVAACQFPQQLDTDLRLALERNCAYGLDCRWVAGTHTVQVVKLQEPDAPDASVLVKALPPPASGAQNVLTLLRQRSRQFIGQPRAQVEADIARRFGQPPGPAVRPPTPPSPAPATPPAATVQTQTTIVRTQTTKRLTRP